jgi:hypothetical protein
MLPASSRGGCTEEGMKVIFERHDHFRIRSRWSRSQAEIKVCGSAE